MGKIKPLNFAKLTELLVGFYIIISFSCPTFQLRPNSTKCRIPGIPNAPYPDCCESPGPCNNITIPRQDSCMQTTKHEDGSITAIK